MPETLKTQRAKIERGLLISAMSDVGGEKRYWELYRKYGHEKVWEVFSKTTEFFASNSWRKRLFLFVRRWRIRAQRLLNWLEASNADQA